MKSFYFRCLLKLWTVDLLVKFRCLKQVSVYSQSVCDSASYAALQISFYPVSPLQLWCPRVAQGFKWNECSLLTSSVENKRPLSRLAVTQDKILNIDCQQLGTDYPLLEEWVCKSVSDYVCVSVCVVSAEAKRWPEITSGPSFVVYLIALFEW